jgi:hypothetical protein
MQGRDKGIDGEKRKGREGRKEGKGNEGPCKGLRSGPRDG